MEIESSDSSPYDSIAFPRLPITVPSFVPSESYSRCIDSLHSCFQQDKHRTSYDFCLFPDRWKLFQCGHRDDEDRIWTKKSQRYNQHHHRSHFRRRFPRRYSDVVNPLSTKALLVHNESLRREKANYLSTAQHRRASMKNPRRILPNFAPVDSTGLEDFLAQRMQAAMGSELMHSLDRNFVSTERKKLLMARSQSFNICTLSNNYNRKMQHHYIPRAQYRFQREDLSILNDLTPDYTDEFLLRKKTINNQGDQSFETSDDLGQPTTIPELDEKSCTRTDQVISSPFILPPTITSSSDEDGQTSSTPPAPPPLPSRVSVDQKPSFKVRCRTIADYLTSDHKLILKDEDVRNNDPPVQTSVLEQQTVGSCSRKPLQTSRSFSTYETLSTCHADETDLTTICAKVSISDETAVNALSSSSPGETSVNIDREYETRSSSSRIYHDYKKRTSSVSIPSSAGLRSHHSMIIHPMHTRIGFRSSTSSLSTANEKMPDINSTGKQMNVCVINQLNEHLSARFRQQQQQQQQQQSVEVPIKNNFEQESYDLPPENRITTDSNDVNFYDEPNELLMTNESICVSSIPPPPPPLPVGGFRSLKPTANILKSSNSPHITETRRSSGESNPLDHPLSARSSIVSSNLSDTRILHELRSNPLFAKAKQHLDLEPGSNGRRSGRRLIGSTMNLSSNESPIKETVTYVQLNGCTKNHYKTSPPSTASSSSSSSTGSSSSSSIETIIMHPDELNRIMMGKRTKSTQDISQHKTGKIYSPAPCRVSELELIFQKRAQRNGQKFS